MYVAAAHGTTQQLQQLLQLAEASKLVNVPDSKGCTPLMLAAQAMNVEACLLLLQTPFCDVAPADVRGRTALHYMCERQPLQVGDLAPYTEALELFYDKGVVSSVDQKGLLPLHTACEAGNYTAVSTILEHEPDIISKGTVRNSEKKLFRFLFRTNERTNRFTNFFYGFFF